MKIGKIRVHFNLNTVCMLFSPTTYNFPLQHSFQSILIPQPNPAPQIRLVYRRHCALSTLD